MGGSAVELDDKSTIFPLCANGAVRLARFSQGEDLEREIVSENPSRRPKNTANHAAGRGLCGGL